MEALRKIARWRAWLVAPLVLAGMSAAVSAAPAEPTCFSGLNSKALGLEIYQQAPPPVSGRERSFVYFPASAFVSQSMDRLWQARGGAYQLYYFQWANRSNEPLTSPEGVTITRKLNFQPGFAGALDQRTAFTSIRKADACTLAQTAAVLGKPFAGIDDALREAGVQPRRMAGAGKAGVESASDLCVIPPRPLPPDAAGVMLDYEVQDGRTPDHTLAFLTGFAELVRGAGRRPMLLVDPFDAPTQAYTGISPTNANAIHRLFDRTTLFAWSRNAQGDIGRSLAKQMEILQTGGPVEPKRLIVDFELANTSQDDARVVRRFIEEHGLAGAFFWRNRARQGGSCASDVNQKIACVALGACAAAH